MLWVLGLGALALVACAEPEPTPMDRSAETRLPRQATAAWDLLSGANHTDAAATLLSLAAEAPAAIGVVAQPQPVVDWSLGPMTGTWKGQWSLYGHEAEGNAKITLRHYDESFNGYIDLSSDVGAVCGKTSGVIVWGLQFDDYVTFGFYDIYSYGYTFHGTVHDNVLTGDFVAINDCGAQNGTFSVHM